MRDFLSLSGVVACVIFGALGFVFLLTSIYGIPLLPFFIAGIIKLVDKLA